MILERLAIFRKCIKSNPFGTNIGAFDKENTLAYDYSNGVNLGLSSKYGRFIWLVEKL